MFLFNIGFSSSANWSLSNLQKINVHELYTRQRQSLRPWFEFFNTTKFKLPVNVPTGISKRKINEKIYFDLFEAFRRLLANVEHFQTNYFVIIAIISIYCL